MAWTPQVYDGNNNTDRKARTVAATSGLHFVCIVSENGARGAFCVTGFSFFVLKFSPTPPDIVVLSNTEAAALLVQYAALLP